MPRSELNVSSKVSDTNGERQVNITLANPGNHIAFLSAVFPHETRMIIARFSDSVAASWTAAVRVEGYNVSKRIVPLP
jgi:hypothetical protein